MLDFVGRLRSLLLADAWFVEVLRAVREGNLPDWVVGSGVIRSLVWDRLHGFERRTPVRDVDVAFFDRANPSRERDEEVEVELRRRLPSVPWQVTNQAGVHLWYERRFGHPSDPIASIEDAVGRWPETATAVAVRLLPDDDLLVIAPCGLDDLFGLILRRNSRQVTQDYFRERLESKAIRETWPKVTVIDRSRVAETRRRSGR